MSLAVLGVPGLGAFNVDPAPNKTFPDVMIDFETLGKGPNKAICQVGAVFFNRVTGELGAEFKATIDARTHEKYGGKVDADTVYFWLKQNDAARNSILSDSQDIVVAMNALNEFLRPAKRIWSHATFDFVLLMDTLKQLGIQPSMSYKAGMDLRTLVYLGGLGTKVDADREGTHHDGLDDAKHQVKYCVAALNAVKLNRKLLGLIERIEE